MKLSVDISDEQLKNIRRDVEEEITESITEEAIFDAIGDPKRVGFSRLLTEARLDDRYKAMDLDLQLVKDLSKEEKMFLITKWIFDYMYEY